MFIQTFAKPQSNIKINKLVSQSTDSGTHKKKNPQDYFHTNNFTDNLFYRKNCIMKFKMFFHY